MKRIFLFILLMVILMPSIVFSESDFNDEEYNLFQAKGKVIEILSDLQSTEDYESGFLEIQKQVIKVLVTTGKYKDQEFVIENHVSGNPAFDIIVQEGDYVLLEIAEFENEPPQIYVSNFVRDRYLAILLAVFFGLLIIIGKMKGIKSVISLTITATVILKLMLPLILKGFSPIWVAVLAATIITSITFIIIGGINIKSFSAIIGTIGGVVIAGILAYIVGSLVKLTGLSSEEASMLMYIPQQINFDFRGLLFAGIIIGTLGAVMDIGMSIASAMYEMKMLNPEISPKQLIVSGLNIGKDVMGTMSNTLILAYTGSAIPLLLLFMAYDTSFVKIINLDLIATEVVRALVGSIGLIIAIPITALSTGIILKFSNSKKYTSEDNTL